MRNQNIRPAIEPAERHPGTTIPSRAAGPAPDRPRRLPAATPGAGSRQVRFTVPGAVWPDLVAYCARQGHDSPQKAAREILRDALVRARHTPPK